MAKNFQKFLVVLTACLLFAGIASAGSVIVTRPGDPEGSPNTISPAQQLAASWFQNFASINTDVTVHNVQAGDEAVLVTFQLLFDSPTGAPVVPQQQLTIPRLGITSFLFQDLSLDAGTYFLVASTGGLASWLTGDFGLEGAAAGAGFGDEYIGTLQGDPEQIVFGPGPGFFGASFTVEGDFAGGEIPEPGTLGLIGAGLLLVAGVVRRRRS